MSKAINIIFKLVRNQYYPPPLGKGVDLHLNKFKYLSPKDALCQDWLKNLRSGSGGDFLVLSMHFRYFLIISHWKKAWPFIWIDLNSLHLSGLCAKFDWNWRSDSGEEERPFIWTNLNPKNALCKVWLNLAEWFWRRVLNGNLFLLLSPLEKGVVSNWNLNPHALFVRMLRSCLGGEDF